MVSKKSPTGGAGVPLYRKVQSQIEEMVVRGGISGGSALTDAVLSDRFGVSRITVRRAVDELVDAGMLYRIQGVGTFARPRKLSEKLTLNNFIEEWSQSNQKLRVRVGAFERIAANEEIAGSLRVQIGEPLVYVQRLRFQKNTLLAVDNRYLRAKNCSSLTAKDITTLSLVDYLQDRENIKLGKGEMDIEARSASLSESRLLKIKKGMPVLIRSVAFYDSNGAPILAGSSIYRADRITYRVNVSAA